ncbi:pyridoxamine 5'-phosphate oxidase family protein [Haladaptatus sp. DFWS20]|uniref:pyridoxamine 5'-phosphate oxidase family protein n=1 Tax=Haladaptatus sp. DFWS20 TaxID=3403467 RepID=UPI003EB9907A
MTTYSGAWTELTVSKYLDRTTVPLRIACHTPADRLWIVSLWYLFRDGKFHCATAAHADIVRFLEHDSNVGFEVSTNKPPYKGIRGSGVASIESDPEKTVLRELLDRYVGDTGSEFAERLLSDERDEVTLQIDPERVFSWDFTERMQEVEDK